MTITKERIRELAASLPITWVHPPTQALESAIRLGIREGLEVAARKVFAKADKCRDLESDSGALGFDTVAAHLCSCASILAATASEVRAITIEGESDAVAE